MVAAAASSELPLVTTILLFICYLSIASLAATWIVYYYARKGMSLVVRISCTVSYTVAFMFLYVISLDMTHSYRDSLHMFWTLYFVTVSAGCWVIVPLQQSYHDNGGFTFKDKILHALKDEGTFYLVVAIVAGLFLIYIFITSTPTWEELWSLVLNLANTFGFLLLTFFFGSGLVNLPLSIWNRSNRKKGLKFCLYKLGKLNETIAVEQDRLQQVNIYVQQLITANAYPRDFASLVDAISAKLPPSNSYEFAFIGQSNCIEDYGALEKLQKIGHGDLKRKHIIALHYIVINHRRQLGMFKHEWDETIERYIYLNKLAHLKEDYPKLSALPPSALISPGESTYSNFPGSFLWTLPFCCGERQTEQSLARYSVNGENDTIDALQIAIADPETQDASSSTSEYQPPSSDIYDDMASRHASNLGDLGVRVTIKEESTGSLSNWLFRKAPYLVPGTIYYRLTWMWFKYVVYLQPWALRIIAGLCALCSIMFLWCEITIMFPAKYNLSPLAHLNQLTGLSPSIHIIVRVLPLVYIAACTYYTVFNINLGWWFNMQPRHRTGEGSLLFSCGFLLRVIFTTTFNYYQMSRITDTAFTDFVGPMAVIPLLGDHFNRVMPLFVAAFALLTAIQCWSAFMKCLGVPHFSFSMSDSESEVLMLEGRTLIDRDTRRRNGERVEHFRGKDVDAKNWAARREQRKLESGETDTHQHTSAAVQAIRDRVNRERIAKEHDAEVSAASPGSTSDSSKKYQRFHSQREARVGIDDW